MKLAGLLAAGALLAANPFHAGDTASRSRHQETEVENLQGLARKATEPLPTPVVPGGPAPDFSYETPDHEWRRLRDLLEQGAVLLVIGARDPQLLALERERDALLDLGVLPVALFDGNTRAVRSAARRLKLRYTAIPDPQSVIARQFNALAPRTNAPEPCWFVIDRKGRVRAIDRTGLPEQGYAAIAAHALALPSPGVSLPAGR